MQPKGKSALLVLDLANVSGLFATYAPRAASGDSAQIDLNKLRSALGSISQVPVTEAIACTHTNDGRERYVSIVRACGYRAVTRPLRTVSDGQGGAHRICNMDAEVAAEAMLRSKDHDTVIIGSGDADFAPLVDSLKADGKRVYIASHNRGVATELLNAAGRTNFIDLGSYHNAVRLRPELPQEFPGPPADPVMSAEELGSPTPSGKSMLLVDGQFLCGACQAEGWQMDWGKFGGAVQQKFGPLAGITLFDRETASRQGLHDTMSRRYGWNLMTKAPKISANSCSMAVDMSCAAVEAARQGHGVVLATGSGHLFHLVNRLKNDGCSVALAAPSQGLSAQLRAAFADNEVFNASAHRAELSRPVPGYAARPYMRPLATPSTDPAMHGFRQ